MTHIPIVDISSYGLGVANVDNADPKEVKSVADDLYAALSGIGFCYITNHGIPKEEVMIMLLMNHGYLCNNYYY